MSDMSPTEKSGHTMKIAIIGGGFAGLSTAKVLRQFGFDVVVHEKAPDVGGVWSSTRRYPGVRTQNNKGTYHLSDLKMPRSYPEWPTGQQVQEYLESYARKFNLDSIVRLGSEVISAVLVDGDSAWEVTSRGPAGDTCTERYDYVIVANGIFSEPFIPPLNGRDDFEAAGGKVMASGDFHDLEEARDRHVVLLGYGKSSCDVAIPVSDVAASTTVIARELLWKLPKKLGGILNYKYLMLTRFGESLFRYHSLRGAERLIHGKGDPVRRKMLGSVQSIATRQLGLKKLGLVPDGSFENIGRSTVSLVTDGFYARVHDSRIAVHRDCVISRLFEKDGKPWAELTTGDLMEADLVICATGFRQQVPFFDEKVNDQLTDQYGNFMLYRQIHPIHVPRLSFAGYNSSFFSPLSAEMSAVWIASHLLGCHELPPVDEQVEMVTDKLAWMEERTNGQHARGTNIIPFSMHNIDEVLDNINLNLGPATRFFQWLGPVRPSSYRSVARRLERRAAKRGLLNEAKPR